MFRYAWLLAIVLSTVSVSAQTVLTVPSTNYPTIQSALQAASSGDVVEVSPGNYAESDLTMGGEDILLRSTSGPAVTVIDAQATGRCFLFTSGESLAAQVVGFTIRQGRSPDGIDGTTSSPDGVDGTHGGAVLIQNSSPTFRDCLFLANEAGHGGDALGLSIGNPGSAGGSGGSGGAVHIDGGHPFFLDCEFRQNVAGDGGDGAGTGFPTISLQPGDGSGGAGGDGGAIHVAAGGVEIDGCVFENNHGGDGGDGSPSASLGGASGLGGGGGSGGAIRAAAGAVLVRNSSFTLNSAGSGGTTPSAIGGPAGDGGAGGDGGAIAIEAGVSAEIERSSFDQNDAGDGGVGGTSGSFFGAIGVAGTGGAGGSGGAVVFYGSVIADALVMLGNEAGDGGDGGDGFGVVSGPGGAGGFGGGIAVLDGTSLVRNTIVARNEAGDPGNGGAEQNGNAGPAGAGGSGGGVLSAVGALEFLNGVIHDNDAGGFGVGGINFSVPGQPGVGAGVVLASGSATYVNTIFRENLDLNLAPSSIFDVPGSIVVEFCNVQGAFGGPGNFDLDPMFVDAANDDFHLQPGSPCLDVGDSGHMNLALLDFEGEPRVVGGAVDVGADEFASQPLAIGQAPRAGLAVLDVNGSALNDYACDVSCGARGPYRVTIVEGGTITFDLEGTPGEPIILLWGNLNPGAAVYDEFFGQFDIGGAPDATGIPSGLTVFADGTTQYLPNNGMFTDSSGLTSASYTLPSSFGPGLLTSFQAAVFRAGGCALSNAVEVTLGPVIVP